jgi:hypothetical protein
VTLRFDLTETLERVLSEPRFNAPVESWWDRFWGRVITEAVRLLAVVIDAVGGPVIAAFLSLGLVGAVTLLVAVRIAGRRASVVEDRVALERLLEIGADPVAYIHRSEEASARGDHALAIRLRFVGEVLELGRRGRIRFEPGLTTAGIADQVDDPKFHELAEQFDAIAYGNASASQADDEKSKSHWTEMKAVR